MQVSVQVKEGLQRSVMVEVPHEEIAVKYRNKLGALAKKVKIDGYRPGKASIELVALRHGDNVRAELVNEEIRKSLIEALEKNKLRPVGSPNIVIEEDGSDNKSLRFSADFEVFPEIKLADLTQITVEHPRAVITDALLDETLGKVRKQLGMWEEVTRPAQNEDLLNIDYELQTDELDHDKKHAHNFAFILGAGQMISGFDEQLIGAKPGDKRMLDVVFPTEYHEKALAGKPMKIEVTLHKISEKRPADDKALCALYKLDENDIDGVKLRTREQLEKEVNAVARVKMKEQLLDQLLVLNPVELPTVLVAQEEALLKEHQMQLLEPKVKEHEAKGVSREQAIEETVKEEAKRKVSLSMLLGEYIRKHEIKPDNQRVFETIQEMTRGHQQPEEMAKWFFENEERIQSVVSFVLEEQAVDGMLEEAKHEDKEVSFEELMR